MDKILEKDLPPDEKLRLIIRNHVQDIIVRSLSMFSVFFSEESQLPQEEFQKIRKEKEKYTRIIQDIIADGIEKGVFREVDPRLQAFAILGMCNWIYKWYKPGAGYYDPERIVEHFMGLLEHGYLKDGTNGTNSRPTTEPLPDDRDDPGDQRMIYRELKAHCQRLSDLVEHLK
jgi:hypothetical protein